MIFTMTSGSTVSRHNIFPIASRRPAVEPMIANATGYWMIRSAHLMTERQEKRRNSGNSTTL